MKDIKSYGGFVTNTDTYRCLLLASNDFTTKEIDEITTGLDLNPNEDFYKVSETVFNNLKNLENYYLSLTEEKSKFANRIYRKSMTARKTYQEYENSLISLNIARGEYEDSLKEDSLIKFQDTMISFFTMVKNDFMLGEIENKITDSSDYMLLLPIINAGCRSCDFYKKEVKNKKGHYSISLDEEQQKQVNSIIQIKIMETINDNLESLSIARENKNGENDVKKLTKVDKSGTI